MPWGELQVVGRYFVALVTKPADLLFEPHDLFTQFTKERFELFGGRFDARHGTTCDVAEGDRSRKETPKFGRFGDAFDAHGHRGLAHGDPELLVARPDVVEGFEHGLLQALLEELGLPHEAL
jgi:hypothetical protein